MPPEVRWHSGHNLAGFFPDPDVVACSPTWQEAADYLTSTMVEYADADDDDTYANRFPENMTAEEETAWWDSDEVPAMRAAADSILKDDPPQPEKDYSVTIEDGRLRHVAFWLMKVTCQCEDSEDGDA